MEVSRKIQFAFLSFARIGNMLRIISVNIAYVENLVHFGSRMKKHKVSRKGLEVESSLNVQGKE